MIFDDPEKQIENIERKNEENQKKKKKTNTCEMIICALFV